MSLFKKNNPEPPKPTILRQGDIILIEQPIDVSTLKKCLHGNLTLAYGEVTGHAHRLDGPGTIFSEQDITEEDMEKFANTGEAKSPLYLVVDNTVNLKHEEHAPIPIEGKKVFEVRRQREFDVTEGYQRVAD